MKHLSHTVSRAFGKVIVLGEHAVVYGQPALAGALSQGCSATIADRVEGGPRLCIDNKTLLADATGDSLCRAFALALQQAGLAQASLEVTLAFDIPIGAGLGSSAALAVALARALHYHASKALTAFDLAAAAHAIECVFHGNPSGLDALLAQTGSVGLFERRKDVATAECLKPLSLSQPLRLVIADTGVSRSTQQQVQKVAQRRQHLGATADKLFEAIGDLVRMGANAAQKTDWPLLGEVMDANQGMLSALGVSSADIENLVHIARREGALGAKLTGAGGGGCVIALAPGREESVAAALSKHARSVIISSLGAA